jgi:hypothetical protein
MRLLTTFFLAITCFVVNAQSTPAIDGFMGSDFGMTITQVKAVNADKNYDYLDGYEGLVVTKQSFAGFTDCSLIWSFTESGKLFQGKVLTSPDLEAQAMSLYDKITAAISRKYGEGARLERYDYPYEKGDGHWQTAFRLGKGHLMTYWKDENDNTITVELDEDFYIKVTYQDAKLIEVAIAEQNNKNDEDL